MPYLGGKLLGVLDVLWAGLVPLDVGGAMQHCERPAFRKAAAGAQQALLAALGISSHLQVLVVQQPVIADRTVLVGLALLCVRSWNTVPDLTIIRELVPLRRRAARAFLAEVEGRLPQSRDSDEAH